ncbi:MAG TPA: superoxide dismutase [Bacteroidetes bacterium]|nr:superoxide dismutase [Bacteroidota bacterium]
MERRKFLSTVGLGAVIMAIPAELLATPVFDFSIDKNGEFKGHEFPELPYAYDAPEPYIDKMTMEIHYDRHHSGCYTRYLAAIKGSDHESTPLSQVFSKVSKLSAAIRNNGGCYYNHTLFWNNMSPDKSEPSSKLKKAIDENFGSWEKFRDEFNNAAATRFGSGWTWLVMDANKKLFAGSTANQDNPLMDVSELRGTPLLTLDVWEHAYYLKYQNKRPDYISAFRNVINWDEVNKRFEKALSL